MGLEYTNDIISHPDADQSPITVKASKFVVLSAGAFGSPAILERSGIGSKVVLDAVGVKQLVDLPGVGENYQGNPSSLRANNWPSADLHSSDHTAILVPFLASPESSTLDSIFRNEKEEVESKSLCLAFAVQ